MYNMEAEFNPLATESNSAHLFSLSFFKVSHILSDTYAYM